MELRGYPVEVQPVATATSEPTARRLWDVSEQLTGVTWDLQPAPPPDSRPQRGLTLKPPDPAAPGHQ